MLLSNRYWVKTRAFLLCHVHQLLFCFCGMGESFSRPNYLVLLNKFTVNDEIKYQALRRKNGNCWCLCYLFGDYTARNDVNDLIRIQTTTAQDSLFIRILLLIFCGSLCASTAHAPKYDNIQIWKFQLQNYWKQNAAIWARVAFGFGCVFVSANTATHLCIEHFCVVSRRTALLISLRHPHQIIFNIIFIDVVNGLLLSLFTGHFISNSRSTTLSLMTWTNEYKNTVILMQAH